ncbi:MAG TPA: glycosyltransferase [Candidatus Dormibacteraeota bacterium]
MRATSRPVSVVVPTRNEGPNLEALYSALAAALGRMPYEVIVVDDSTDDSTRPLLQEIAGRDHHWRVVERAPADQTGLATAVSIGLRLAKGEIVCVMDGDLQHPPEVIPALVAAIRSGADIAVASRYMPGGSAAGLASPGRRFVSRTVSWVSRFFFSEARRSTDPLSGFFCLRLESVAGLELRPVGFKILLELLVCLPSVKVVDVPFVFGDRFSGSSKATFSQGLLFGRHLLSLFVYVPLAALLAKVTISAGSGIATFAVGLWIFKTVGLPDPDPWVLSAAASLVMGLSIYHLLTFRTAFWRQGVVGHRLPWALGLSSTIGGVACFFVLMARAHLATVVLAVLAQLAAVALGYGLARYARARTTLPVSGDTAADEPWLQGLARRLGAERAWWLEPRAGRPPASDLEAALPPSIVNHVVLTRQPLLVVELPSSRPQARVNVGAYSLMIIPELTPGRRVSKMAVLARANKNSFSARDLHVALAWLSRRPRSAPALEPLAATPDLAAVVSQS